MLCIANTAKGAEMQILYADTRWDTVSQSLYCSHRCAYNKEVNYCCGWCLRAAHDATALSIARDRRIMQDHEIARNNGLLPTSWQCEVRRLLVPALSFFSCLLSTLNSVVVRRNCRSNKLRDGHAT